jgi:hypothetical protein
MYRSPARSRSSLVKVVSRCVAVVGSADGAGVASDAAEAATSRLRALGATVDTWHIDMPALAAHPWFSAEVERGVL